MKCFASGIVATVFFICPLISASEIRAEYGTDSLSEKELAEDIQSLLHKIESTNSNSNTFLQEDSPLRGKKGVEQG